MRAQTIGGPSQRWSWAALGLALGACTPAATSDAGADAASATDAATDAASDAPARSDVAYDEPQVAADGATAPPVRTMRVSIGPIRMNPGEEWTRCVVVPLGTTEPVYVRRVAANLGDSSHHLIIYRANDSSPTNATPEDCQGFSGITENFTNPETPLFIAQQARSEIRMPAGVGFTMPGNARIRLEYHAINATDRVQEVMAHADIDVQDQSGFLTPADVMFWGNTDIDIAPRSRATIDFFSVPPSGTRLFGLTSHTHRFGARPANTVHLATATPERLPFMDFTVTRWTGITDMTELHRSENYSDPPLTLFETPMRFAAGQGLHLVCNYNNTSDQRVEFGESANDEMCFLFGYYYPAPRGTHICVRGFSQRAPEGSVVCWPP